LNLEVDLGNGTAAFTGTETTTQHENCAFGRVDHNFSSRDNIFTSYVLDNGQTVAATVPARATEGDCGLRETTTRDDTVRTKRGNANSPHNSPHTMAPLQSKADWCKFLKGLEARAGIEPAHKGFADLSLTTWVPRHGLPASKAADRSKPPAAQRGLEPGTAEWSGRRDLNSRPSPWQGDALPLSYSRFDANQSIPGGGKWVKQSALCGLTFHSTR
jgi:hypothetical protein